MLLDDALRRGDLGVRFAIPQHLKVLESTPAMVHARDVADGVEWWLFFEPGVHLDLAPAHHGDLAAALEHYGRAMFEQLHEDGRDADADAEADRDRRPRTADPSWSTMVDIEPVTLDTAPALRTVHRMAYEPGREVVMGHLLVPLRRGLFEIRVLASDSLTGVREALLVNRKLANLGGGEAPTLSQAEIEGHPADPGRR
jgi:hypothetical protein